MRLRKIVKTGIYSLLFFLVFVCAYLVSAYVLSRIGVAREKETGNDVVVFILTNGVHTDLVLPVKNRQMDWSREIKYANTAGKDSLMPYVAFGWGDKGFYMETPTWADLKFKTAFKAAFGLSTSAIHATFYKRMQEGKDCKKIYLSSIQYERLIAYVRNSFLQGAGGHAIYIHTTANYGNDDAFYEAKGSYHLFRTCNTWANSALKCCGQKACLWTPFEKGIFYQYSKDN